MSRLGRFCRIWLLNGVKGALARVFVALVVMLTPVLASAEGERASWGEHDSSRPLAARLEADRQQLLSPAIQTGFPRLGNNFEVLGPSTPEFNCVAHSLGLYSCWVNPVTGPESNPLVQMDRLYAAQGYRRRPDLNLALEWGKQKVVVYATLNPDATIAQVTHAALQERDGTWTSKLGRLALIRHETPELLRGSSYGLPVAVYERPAR
jgi:type VI secretion system secreted protein VgrG